MRNVITAARGAAASLAIGLTAAAVVLLQPGPLSSHTPITTKIVFQKEIASIFQRKCFQCHSAHNLAMALTTYTEARPWAVAIKEEILQRRMPPWSAVSGYGHFANDMSLTAREVSLILAWADGGAPSGVLKVDEDKPPVFVPPLRGWERGTPDAVVPVGAGHQVAPNASDTTTRFTVATGLAGPRWLRAWQLNPVDRRVLRYAALYEQATGRWIGTWTPTRQVSSEPSGVAWRLPAHATLVVEMGYRGTEDAAPGEAELGLYFSAEQPSGEASAIDVAAGNVILASRTAEHRVRAEIRLIAPAQATAVWPMLGSGAQSAEVTAIHTDGVVEPLLWVKDFREAWPTAYVFREPVDLPAGTRLVLTAYYANGGADPITAHPRVAVGTFTPFRPASAP